MNYLTSKQLPVNADHPGREALLNVACSEILGEETIQYEFQVFWPPAGEIGVVAECPRRRVIVVADESGELYAARPEDERERWPADRIPMARVGDWTTWFDDH